MAFVLGVTLAAVGWLDVLLLFYPSAWASIDWEFGTISGVFEGLPLGTIGLATMTVAAVGRGWVGAMRLMAAVLLLVAVGLTLLAVVFALDMPVVWRAVNPNMQQTIAKAMAKTMISAFVYVFAYVTLGLWTARRVRATVKGAAT